MLDGLQQTLSPHWLQLQQQCANNPRLRWMLWGILYLFLIYIALVLGEWRVQGESSIKQLQRTAIKLEQLENQTNWEQRWIDEKAITGQLLSRLWKADTEALAEADFQNYLRKLFSDHGSDAFQLRLAPTEVLNVGNKTLFKVSADVSAMIPSTRIDSFIVAMAEKPQVLVVERFGYGAQRSGQVNLLASAFFIASDKSDESAQARLPVEENQK